MRPMPRNAVALLYRFASHTTASNVFRTFSGYSDQYVCPGYSGELLSFPF